MQIRITNGKKIILSRFGIFEWRLQKLCSLVVIISQLVDLTVD